MLLAALCPRGLHLGQAEHRAPESTPISFSLVLTTPQQAGSQGLEDGARQFPSFPAQC